MELTGKVANCQQMVINGEKPTYGIESYCRLLPIGTNPAVTCKYLNICPSQEEAIDLAGTGFYPCSAYQKKDWKK